MTKLPALTPDDPLRPTPPPPPSTRGGRSRPTVALPPTEAAPDAETPGHPAPSPADPAADATLALASAPRRAGRSKNGARPEVEPVEWSGTSDVITLRLPAEVAQALEERRYRLRVPKGMAVAAALGWLLERSDDELIELVEQTQERFESARRRARRAG